MILQEPLTMIINKNKNYAMFKVNDNVYKFVAGTELMLSKEDAIDLSHAEFIPDEINDNNYTYITGDDVIPYIVLHNYNIQTTIDEVDKKCSNEYLRNFTIKSLEDSMICNKINLDILQKLIERFK